MSLSALNTAAAGLKTTQAAIGIVSQNIANVGTTGYVKRSLDTVAQGPGNSGVAIGTINRVFDENSLKAAAAGDVWRGLYGHDGGRPDPARQALRHTRYDERPRRGDEQLHPVAPDPRRCPGLRACPLRRGRGGIEPRDEDRKHRGGGPIPAHRDREPAVQRYVGGEQPALVDRPTQREDRGYQRRWVQGRPARSARPGPQFPLRLSRRAGLGAARRDRHGHDQFRHDPGGPGQRGDF